MIVQKLSTSLNCLEARPSWWVRYGQPFTAITAIAAIVIAGYSAYTSHCTSEQARRANVIAEEAKQVAVMNVKPRLQAKRELSGDVERLVIENAGGCTKAPPQIGQPLVRLRIGVSQPGAVLNSRPRRLEHAPISLQGYYNEGGRVDSRSGQLDELKANYRRIKTINNELKSKGIAPDDHHYLKIVLEARIDMISYTAEVNDKMHYGHIVVDDIGPWHGLYPDYDTYARWMARYTQFTDESVWQLAELSAERILERYRDYEARETKTDTAEGRWHLRNKQRKQILKLIQIRNLTDSDLTEEEQALLDSCERKTERGQTLNRNETEKVEELLSKARNAM